MTFAEAEQYIYSLSQDGGVYKQGFIFVFDPESWDKVNRALDILDNNRGIWGKNVGQFTTAGMTSYGPVSARLKGYIVIAVHFTGERKLFNPGYLQHVLNTATHELVHAAQFAVRAQSYHDPLIAVEPLAYLTGWLMEKWIYAVWEKFNVTISVTPATTGPLSYNILFDLLYRFNEQRLAHRMGDLTMTQIQSALVRESINSLNNVAVVNDIGWSSTTYLDGVNKK
ncbi:hypothetical protein FDJ23_gp225 [Erwinia phage vB_EamM_Desertfox]|jgi:hypothetical protein|uniref:Uncharacterized protein n=2 Tax=Agricanvirus TaxID=1984776 RepID=A0A2H5BJ59_9CAUD|nr:hypothetical protein FDJ23_gp225 [Erwinia phage vB_EamM_Desertfox]AUG86332.1 hypothetical protein DESERTFOX_225 [Erwinia phage vB_EamM_Desertfox]AUG86978.1 hypothetical protein MORTIMER_230 [Erwinia phage vB_EamM_Mortimer]